MAFFIDRNTLEERRQFRRIRAHSPVEYKFLNSDKFKNSVTCDISEGGVSFTVDGPVPIGTHLYFQVQLRKRPQPICATAKVVWANKEPYSQQYRVGLEFIEVGSISSADIRSMIEESKCAAYNS